MGAGAGADADAGMDVGVGAEAETETETGMADLPKTRRRGRSCFLAIRRPGGDGR
jgi:hypothetical protein